MTEGEILDNRINSIISSSNGIDPYDIFFKCNASAIKYWNWNGNSGIEHQIKMALNGYEREHLSNLELEIQILEVVVGTSVETCLKSESQYIRELSKYLLHNSSEMSKILFKRPS